MDQNSQRRRWRKKMWRNQMEILNKTHKMEIEKHYTSNCGKIVKCGWCMPPFNSTISFLFQPRTSNGKASSISSRYCWVSFIFKERLSIYINSVAAFGQLEVFLPNGFAWQKSEPKRQWWVLHSIDLARQKWWRFACICRVPLQTVSKCGPFNYFNNQKQIRLVNFTIARSSCTKHS